MKINLQACPVCGANITRHAPATEDEYEGWYFDCGGEIYVDDHGWFVAEDECRGINPMRDAVEKINAKLRTKPADLKFRQIVGVEIHGEDDVRLILGNVVNT